MVSKSQDHIHRALAIDDHLIAAHNLLICIHNIGGEAVDEDQAITRALALFPDPLLIRITAMWAKEPRWGGSHRQMAEITKAAKPHVDRNPYLGILSGFIHYGRRRRLDRNDRCKVAESEYRKALAFGDYWSFCLALARVYHFDLKRPEPALENVDRAIALRPTRAETYRLRSKIAFTRNDFDAALTDLATAEMVRPGDENTLEWRQWDRIPGYWNRFLALEPRHAEAHPERSGTHYYNEGMSRAIADLRQACQLGSQPAGRQLR